MTDGLWRFPWGTFTGEQVWEFTNFMEQIEITVFPIIFVLVQSVGALLNIWYSIGMWLLGGQ